MGRYSDEAQSHASHFAEMKTYVQCNIQGQKLDPRCEINKHIFIFTSLKFIYMYMYWCGSFFQ